LKPYSNTDNFIDLELTDEIKKEQIVTSFKKDIRNHSLLLTLNHVYMQKQIVSPVYKGPKGPKTTWDKTLDTLVIKLKEVGVSAPHIDLIEVVLSNNYKLVLDLPEAGQEDPINSRDENAKRSKKVKIRKYTGNGTLPLHESIVFKDGQTAFLTLDENGQPKYQTEIERPGIDLHPADTLDTHNPLPYIFELPDELNHYLERALRNWYCRNFSISNITEKSAASAGKIKILNRR